MKNRSKIVSFWGLILGPKTLILLKRSSLFQEPVLAWTGSALKIINLSSIRKHVQAFGCFARRGQIKAKRVQSQASMGKHVRALINIAKRVQTEANCCKIMRAWASMGKRLGHLVNIFRSIVMHHSPRFARLALRFDMWLTCICSALGMHWDCVWLVFEMILMISLVKFLWFLIHFLRYSFICSMFFTKIIKNWKQ